MAKRKDERRSFENIVEHIKSVHFMTLSIFMALFAVASFSLKSAFDFLLGGRIIVALLLVILGVGIAVVMLRIFQGKYQKNFLNYTREIMLYRSSHRNKIAEMDNELAASTSVFIEQLCFGNKMIINVDAEILEDIYIDKADLVHLVINLQSGKQGRHIYLIKLVGIEHAITTYLDTEISVERLLSYVKINLPHVEVDQLY